MKHAIAIAIFLAALSPCVFAASPAATQSWVKNYVMTNTANASTVKITQTVSAEDGTSTLSFVDPSAGLVTMTMNMQDKLALFVTNCTVSAVALNVTNGTLFAWNGSTQFVNSVIGQTIYSPTTNRLTFAGIGSVTNAVCDTIPGYFDIYGCRIDRPTATALLGE